MSVERQRCVVDVFSGVGGLALGAKQAGFDVVAAFDNDAVLSSSFAHNFPETAIHHIDVSSLSGEEVLALTGRQVDGVVGGPPCQGFSVIGRRRASDPRRDLLGHFFRIVSELQPSFFVMENVLGLMYRDARLVLESALKLVKGDYALFGPATLDAADFGAATRRRRLFVIGVRNKRGEAPRPEDFEAVHQIPATVRAAIGDLEGAVLVGEDRGFDVWKIQTLDAPCRYASGLRSSDDSFTGHRATAHSLRVVDRFNGIAQGSVDRVGRHARLAWSGQCPTLRAGTGPDCGSYQSVRPIHPEKPRVITVREAARIQGFPDWFRFHPTIWHSFRMIGNSVSPIMARAIFGVVSRRLASTSASA